jgi:two-component system, NarL family, nitrate/nitrite response regulator NarL
MSVEARVLVVDDHPIVRRGLRTLLAAESWVDSVVEAATMAEAVARAVEHRITVAAMDVALPDGDGIEATRRILRARPGTNVLMLSMTDDEEVVIRALRAGAHGYVRKDIPPEQLCDALRTVAFGGVVLGPEIGTGVLATLRRPAATLPSPFDRLSAREREILAHLAAGESNASIARRLGISEKTVRNQVSAVFTKLGVPDRIKAALLVRDAGVLPDLAGPAT